MEEQIMNEEEKRPRKKSEQVKSHRRIFIAEAAAIRIEQQLDEGAKTSLSDIVSKLILKARKDDIEREVGLCERLTLVKENLKDEDFKEALMEMLGDFSKVQGVH